MHATSKRHICTAEYISAPSHSQTLMREGLFSSVDLSNLEMQVRTQLYGGAVNPANWCLC